MRAGSGSAPEDRPEAGEDGRRDSPPEGMARQGPNTSRMLHQLLKLTNRLMTPFSTHLEKQYRITLNEFRLLMTIGRLGSSASHELAERTGVNVMSVSRAVSALERQGRISVSPDPANRRRKTLQLTEEGQRLYEIMRPQTGKVADYLFTGLSHDDLAALDRILDTMIDRLEARDEQGRSLFVEETRPEGGER